MSEDQLVASSDQAAPLEADPDQPGSKGGPSDDQIGSDAKAPAQEIDTAASNDTSGNITLHSFIEKQLTRAFLLRSESEEEFRELLEAVVKEWKATTLSEQLLAFEHARKTFADMRYDGLKTQVIISEMRSATVAVYKRHLEAKGRRGAVSDIEAQSLAEKAHLGSSDFDDVELSVEGWGEYPIDTEAATRALPALSQLEKLSASNQRAKTGTLKELKLMKTFVQEK
jgi:hypothetical protein